MTNPGFRILAALLSVSVCGAQGHAADGAAPTQVIVNAVPLSADTLRALQRMYPVPIQPGRYWYDRVSGAYGFEGGPIAGQMRAGLKLGGPLRADASRGTSGVFINGRQLTLGEKSYLVRTCQTRVPAATGSTPMAWAASKTVRPCSTWHGADSKTRRTAAAVRAPEPTATLTVRARRRACGVRYSRLGETFPEEKKLEYPIMQHLSFESTLPRMRSNPRASNRCA
jgi:hypothetical protein